ncbi:DUF4123 domain-containing protein [Janthinobacterium agaricidamnosum]|uniref:DUF4123 domain-containing protein n=1 Tax=Janthinobacterium agaricidamnosum NBRC 102515 = DSM 9628 TaxID=1349767 RepID=W0V4L9_9BURK|nr:DUF4123 domain-containing protein [Janthinobacterium agaricidamnosum]CDG83774.1 hypothetical protein GJA_3152 [Janthinobacterium agaricidamnosum NBRC 102515 = DSM 9628]
MLTDPFTPQWITWLDAQAAGLQDTQQLYLLLDGVFIPGLYRTMQRKMAPDQKPTLLFEALPSCNDKTRDVSPFLLAYRGQPQLSKLLSACSGWPMVSAIVTTESAEQLGRRLAAWCVVEADSQRFNFRFPDTRRLPGIFNALTGEQRAMLCGPASTWFYIGRNGDWATLDVPQVMAPLAESPTLEAGQFGVMVDDSEADGMLARFDYRGLQWQQPHSTIHALVQQGLKVAAHNQLDSDLWLDWCAAYIDQSLLTDTAEAARQFPQWKAQYQ